MDGSQESASLPLGAAEEEEEDDDMILSLVFERPSGSFSAPVGRALGRSVGRSVSVRCCVGVLRLRLAITGGPPPSPPESPAVGGSAQRRAWRACNGSEVA